MDQVHIVAGVLVAIALVLSAAYAITSSAPVDPCLPVNRTLEASLSGGRSCVMDSDCAVVFVSCEPEAVALSASNNIANLSKRFDACYPKICGQGVVKYDAFCNNGKCATIVSGYTDRLYADIVYNRSECANPNVSGYSDPDHCFLALRLKAKYRPKELQKLICDQIAVLRIREDCLSIRD